MLLTIISSCLTPSAITLCSSKDEWVTIYAQDFSEIDAVPLNIHTIKSLDTEQPAVKISKNAEDDFLLIEKGTGDRGTVDLFGFTPSIRTRYTIDLEWSNSYSDSWSGAGVIINVGGVRLFCFSSSGGSRFYIRGQYFNASNDLNLAFFWELGSSSRASITIDTDTALGKAYLSYTNTKVESPFYRFFWQKEEIETNITSTFELPYYRYRWTEDKFLNTFTPDTIVLTPLSANSADEDDSTIIKLYRVTQEIYAPNPVVAIGSTKYQAFGYDGPHTYRTVAEGMDEIRDANMNATIFADVGYIRDQTYVEYLKGLIADGWELGIHYSEGLSTMKLANATTMMMDEYSTISEAFGTHPLTWCSLGNLDNSTYSLLAKKNLNMVFRSLRVIPQNVPGSTDITNPTINYWLGAARSGASTVPIYVHQTEVEPQPSRSSVDASKFDVWLNYIIANGVRLTGFYKWYMINSNQLDAEFYTYINGTITTIIANTNGYNAIILAQIKSDSVIAVQQNKQIIEYSTTPGGYIIFEVEDGGKYKIITINDPVIKIDYNILLMCFIGLVAILIIIIVINIFMKNNIKHDDSAINSEEADKK